MHINYTNDFGQTVQVSLPLNWRLARNFTLQELANNKAKETVKFISTPRSRKFLTMIQEFRDWYGEPMTVSSNYRTRSYNTQIGGAYSSLHLDALALDWKAVHNEKRRVEIRKKWMEICKAHGETGGINFYSHGYHMDIGEEKFGYRAFVTRDYRGKRGDW